MEQRAAPAAKDRRGAVEGMRDGSTAKDSAIGREMPVRATAMDKGRVCLVRREGSERVRPPVWRGRGEGDVIIWTVAEMR